MQTGDCSETIHIFGLSLWSDMSDSNNFWSISFLILSAKTEKVNILYNCLPTQMKKLYYRSYGKQYHF